MSTQKLYDVIVVGASFEGILLCEYLLSKKPDIKIAVISKNFDILSNRHKLLNVDKFEDTVIYSTYLRGIIGAVMKGGRILYCTNLVIATGTKPEKLPFDANNIYYKTTSVKNPSKFKQAVVFGSDVKALNAAIWASKKFRYVYFCNPDFKLKSSKKEFEKLSSIENIVYLPNSNITNVRINHNNDLVAIELSTYDLIKCNAIIAITDRTPEVPGLDKKMIELEDGYVKIDHHGATTLIPKVYAVGECTKYKSRRNVAIVGKTILLINGWKYN